MAIDVQVTRHFKAVKVVPHSEYDDPKSVSEFERECMNYALSVRAELPEDRAEVETVKLIDGVWEWDDNGDHMEMTMEWNG